jgi:GT2 family glycosyltransferase
MPEPRVAILILNWNGWKDTIECLDSVVRLEYDNYVIVLCDNASTDGSLERVRAWSRNPEHTDLAIQARRGQGRGRPLPKAVPLVELTREQAEAGHAVPAGAPFILIHNGGNLGFAQGNNVGLRYVLSRPDFDFVWILNNDVVVDPRSLAELVVCAQGETAIAGVGATIFEYNEPEVVQAAGGGVFSLGHASPRLISKPRHQGGRAKDAAPLLDFISGACMLVRTSELRTVGLIDESYFIYCEDVDLSVRIRANGSSLAHARNAKIWHKGGSTFGHRSPRHDYYTIRNTMALVRKYHPVMTPFVGAFLIYRAVIPKLVRRQWTRLAAVWRGYRDYRSRVTGPLSP